MELAPDAPCFGRPCCKVQPISRIGLDFVCKQLFMVDCHKEIGPGSDLPSLTAVEGCFAMMGEGRLIFKNLHRLGL
jgi:hypothetical protein